MRIFALKSKLLMSILVIVCPKRVEEMKYIRRALIIAFGLFIAACASYREHAPIIKVMSYNIRCGYCEPIDSINHWSKRKTLVAQIIRDAKPQLIGLQEAEKFQVLDLANLLSDYEWYGIGRDDGGTGEMNAILVDKSRFRIEAKETIHLSPTPYQVSLGWDARFKRTLTKVKLRDLKTGKIVNFFNSHFDHIGKVARLNSARLITDEVRKIGNEPLILTGDFNDRPGFDGYRVLSSSLLDAAIISDSLPKGGDISFNGFGADVQPGNKIDYIFVSQDFSVRSHETITKLYDGKYPSDHFAIVSSLRLR